MQSFKIVFIFSLSFWLTVVHTQDTRKSNLAYGKYSVGFDTVRIISKSGDTLLFSIWFPAKKNDHEIKLRDYVVAGSAIQHLSDSDGLNNLKNSIIRLYNVNFSDYDFTTFLSKSSRAYLHAQPVKGKFPLIIAQSQPHTYYNTFEYFASHGFIVAGVMFNYGRQTITPPDSLMSKQQTDYLADLLDYMLQQPFVDTSSVTAFGHGGGIQSAGFLAMRDSRIRKLLNLDGGFFGPRSKTTSSIDYHPSKLTIPFLHVITKSQSVEDDPIQFKNLRNPIIRVTFKNEAVRHHDFTVFGKIVVGMGKRVNEKTIYRAVESAEELMLRFLLNKPLKEEHKVFEKIEYFNFSTTH
jgi:hypothetical protein